MIENLPIWNFNNLKPSFNDLESATAVEMVYKLYGKNRELIDDYNKFLRDIKNEVEEFKTSTNQDLECFKAHITKIMHDYIMKIDEKIKMQDLKIETSITEQNKVIEDAIVYIKNNITETAESIISQAIANGEIGLSTTYNAASKKLSFVITNTSEGGEQ